VSRVHRVTKAEITRVVAGLKAAGETVAGIQIEPGGKVTVLIGKPEATLTPLQLARAELAKRRAAGDQQYEPLSSDGQGPRPRARKEG
jgi:hypothetical protein